MLNRESLEASKGSTEEAKTQNRSESQARDTALEVTTRSLHVRYIVAGNPNTPREVLAKLSTDVLETVRRRVADNPRTPVNALLQLAHDPSVDVRLAVAENPNTPAEVLEKLAADDDVDVRYGVAENPHIPIEYLRRLSEDGNPYVACRAQKTLKMIDALC